MKNKFRNFRLWVAGKDILLEDYKIPFSANRGYTKPGWYYLDLPWNTIFKKWSVQKEIIMMPAVTPDQLKNPSWAPDLHSSQPTGRFCLWFLNEELGEEVFKLIAGRKRGFGDLVRMTLVPEKDQKWMGKIRIGPDKNILMKDFFRKPVGQPFEFEKKLKEFFLYRKNLRDKETKDFGEVLYHASTKSLEVGDIIAPYWTKDLMAQREAPQGFDRVNPVHIENDFEKVRPGNKVSRLECVFAYADAGRAFAHQAESDEGSRFVYAVQPLPKSNITVADQAGMTAYAADISDLLSVEDEEGEEYLEQSMAEIIKKYWDGVQVSGGGPLEDVDKEILIGEPGVKIVKILRGK